MNATTGLSEICASVSVRGWDLIPKKWFTCFWLIKEEVIDLPSAAHFIEHMVCVCAFYLFHCGALCGTNYAPPLYWILLETDYPPTPSCCDSEIICRFYTAKQRGIIVFVLNYRNFVEEKSWGFNIVVYWYQKLKIMLVVFLQSAIKYLYIT